MVPANSTDCTSMSQIRQKGHVACTNHLKTDTDEKTKPTQREGEKISSLPVFSPAVGLSSAPGAAAEEGSAVPAHSAHLPPC